MNARACGWWTVCGPWIRLVILAFFLGAGLALLGNYLAETMETPRPAVQAPEPPPPDVGTQQKSQPPTRGSTGGSNGSGPDAARLAILVDDLGWGSHALPALLSLGVPLNYAVIPRAPLADRDWHLVRKEGWDILVHLPMQPLDPSRADPGPGAIRVDMDDLEIATRTREMVRSIPFAVGLNNHMGSAATAEPRVMRAVMGVVKEEGLFFLDSMTNPRSAGPAVARELGVRYLENQLFLDNDLEKEYVKSRIRQAVSMAREEGQAVAIMHPHVVSAEALSEMVPEIQSSGVRLVRLRELLSGSGRGGPGILAGMRYNM